MKHKVLLPLGTLLWFGLSLSHPAWAGFGAQGTTLPPSAGELDDPITGLQEIASWF